MAIKKAKQDEDEETDETVNPATDPSKTAQERLDALTKQIADMHGDPPVEQE